MNLRDFVAKNLLLDSFFNHTQFIENQPCRNVSETYAAR
jgi:hypothetical protein